MPHSPQSKPDANGPLTGGPFACVLAIHSHGGDHGVATRCLISCARQRMGRVERNFNVDDRAVRIRRTERDPATGCFEPDPPGCHSEMARAETSIKINPRHNDAIITDPERGPTYLAGQLDRDRTRLGMLDHVGDQLPGGGQLAIRRSAYGGCPPSSGSAAPPKAGRER